MEYYLGIDLGTRSVKCLLVDKNGGEMAFAQIGYEIIVPQAGFAEQNPMQWWDSTVDCIQKVLQKADITPKEIKGIGLSGQMHGTVLLDKNNCVLTNAIIHCDARSQSAVDEIYNKLDKQRFFEITCNPLFCGTQAASIYWIRKNLPEVFAKINKVMLPKDYIRYKLTGEYATEITDASSSLLYDTVNNDWSEEILNSVGLDKSIMPKIGKPYEQAGGISESVAQLTGLCKNTCVVYGAGDQSAQAIGSGVINVGDATSNIGTAGQIFTPIKSPIKGSNNTNTFAFAPNNMWFIMGAILNAGVALDWFVKDILKLNSFDDSRCNIMPNSGDPIFLPYLCGERTPHLNPNAKGMFFGLQLGHKQEDLHRAVMEGVVFALNDAMTAIIASGVEINEITASGGGAVSKIWIQMQADIFGREIKTTTSKEQAALGAAILAAVGSGGYHDIKSACDAMVKQGRYSAVPNHIASEIYKQRYDTYKKLYSRISGLF